MVIFTCKPESVSWTPTCHIMILINFLCLLKPHWPCALCSFHPLLLSDSLSLSIPSISSFYSSLSPVPSSRHFLVYPTLPSSPQYPEQEKPNLEMEALCALCLCHRPSKLCCPSHVFWGFNISPLSHLTPQWFSAVSLFLSVLILRTLLWFH